MKVEDGRTAEIRKTLLAFAEQNDVYICDTVMYELLRNLNAKRFRERHALLRNAGLTCLAEDAPVRAMFERLNWLYLSALKNEPWKYLYRQQNDLWIIATGLANGIQYFLTTDASSDFLPDFFATQFFTLDESRHDCTICLHKFDDEKAEKQWAQLEETQECTIRLPKGHLAKLTAESWKNYANREPPKDSVPLFG